MTNNQGPTFSRWSELPLELRRNVYQTALGQEPSTILSLQLTNRATSLEVSEFARLDLRSDGKLKSFVISNIAAGAFNPKHARYLSSQAESILEEAKTILASAEDGQELLTDGSTPQDFRPAKTVHFARIMMASCLTAVGELQLLSIMCPDLVVLETESLSSSKDLAPQRDDASFRVLTLIEHFPQLSGFQPLETSSNNFGAICAEMNLNVVAFKTTGIDIHTYFGR